MDTVKGYVEHIVFRNEDNGYTVFNLNNDDGDLTCVGNFNYLSEGELIEVNGEYVVHSVYGTQLRVLNYEIKAPELNAIWDQGQSKGLVHLLPAGL